MKCFLGMNARHVSRGLFRVANTHCTRSQKSQELCQVIVVGSTFQFPERERRQQRLQVSHRKSKPRARAAISLALHFFVHSYYSSPFSPSSAFILLPFIRSLYKLFFAPCPTNCFRIGESWERSVTVDWIARIR